MYLNVDCGKCGSTINMDSEWEESCWMMLYRFADAHVRCGTFTKTADLPQRIDVTIEDFTDDEDFGDPDGDEDEAVA